MHTEHTIVLGKSWVVSRRPMGRRQLIMCSPALQLNEAVLREIGDTPVFEITLKVDGKSKLMKAVRINNDTVCWEELCQK